MPKVIAINISEKKGVIKTPMDEGIFIKEYGLKGDAHAGNWHRQVSLLAEESIDKLRNNGITDLTPGKFAENITTKGIVLHELPLGTLLKIGDTEMEVTQIGKECHHGCEIRKLTGDCVMPREGIFTRVLKDGIIRPGDDIEIINKD